MTFGEKLTKLRKENNYTQEQLADILNVSRQSVSKWELDTTFPETDKLIEIGKLFNCSMDYLLKEENTTLSENTPPQTKRKLSPQSKKKIKKWLKILGIIFAVFLAIDIISFIVYFSINGLPN